MDVKRSVLRKIRPEFSSEIFAISPHKELICTIGSVNKAIVKIVIYNACASAEWNLTVEIREKVYTIVMMMLDDGKLRVENHPMNQVGELA